MNFRSRVKKRTGGNKRERNHRLKPSCAHTHLAASTSRNCAVISLSKTSRFVAKNFKKSRNCGRAGKGTQGERRHERGGALTRRQWEVCGTLSPSHLEHGPVGLAIRDGRCCRHGE